MPLSDKIKSSLRCPVCYSDIIEYKEKYICKKNECGTIFPIIDSVPVIFNQKNGFFNLKNINVEKNSFYDFNKRPLVKRIIDKFIPNLTLNYVSEKNYNNLEKIFEEIQIRKNENLKILIIGGSQLGQGLEKLINNKNFEFVETDIIFSPRTDMLCDCNNIPFKDNVFDGIINQAVLEHVTDPENCVREIYRVLKTDGILYAELPFMQQVHGGAYDFTRYTHMGVLRLFKRFKEIESGIVTGPGMALAWSWLYFLLSFSKSPGIRKYLRLLACMTAFPFKYFDYYLIKKDSSYDAASGFYFIGKKHSEELKSGELLKKYKGCF